MAEFLTIGHSTLDYERFVSHLKAEAVTALADVRSAPYSRRVPHFSRDALKSALATDGIAYVFLGKELGGRPGRPEHYTDGVADYEAMARAPAFQAGLDRLETGAHDHRIALMCAEADPCTCHRCLLVGRALKARGHDVRHLLRDGQATNQAAIEARLLHEAGRAETDLFAGPVDPLAEAYRRQAGRAAFRK